MSLDLLPPLCALDDATLIHSLNDSLNDLTVIRVTFQLANDSRFVRRIDLLHTVADDLPFVFHQKENDHNRQLDL